MKRNLVAALFAAFATAAYAGNSAYSNQAGEQDLHAPIAAGEQYRNDAGESDRHVSIAANGTYNNEAGKQDQHQPEVG